MSNDDDKVNHPKHYGGDTTYEALKVIDAWRLNFSLGSAVKYICRHGKKPGANAVEDLRKAAFYITREADRLEREGVADTRPTPTPVPSNGQRQRP